MTLPELGHAGRHVTIGGAPEGHDVRLLGELLDRAGSGILHVGRTDAHAERLMEQVRFFRPDQPIVHIPAWDCLPYDRVSPHAEIVARRTDAFCRLADLSSVSGLLVVTTVNAALQRVPRPELFAGARFEARRGDPLDVEALRLYCARNGYTHAQTVREPGEVAFRGGIIDLFPPGSDEPVRLDLFGDELETIRRFDAMTQRTIDTIDRVALAPVSEVTLDEEAVARFRQTYRELFGAVTGDDPLYAAVSEGRRHVGMEHWLPLFHEAMATVFDYLPDGLVVFDTQAEEAIATRRQQVTEFYEARQTVQETGRRAQTPPYKPMPPDRLYLPEEEWEALLVPRSTVQFSPFAGVGEAEGGVDGGGRRGRDFADARRNPDTNLYAEVRAHISALLRDGRRVLVAGYTTGARDRLAGLLADNAGVAVTTAATYADALAAPKGAAVAVVLPLETGFAAPDLAVITEQDVLGDRLTRRPARRRRADAFIGEISSLSMGDLVVHADHGIGRYDGLETLEVGGAAHECLRILYADDDKLFLPVENIELLSRYGSDAGEAAIDRLGGPGWQSRKERVKRRLKDMAEALMKIAAQRALKDADVLMPPEGLYDEFAARFPFPETDDQLRAIEDVMADLGSGRAMDRLVCGDVGFGKTEVALRAAFVAASQGGQAAIVVPTTLLARQHYRTFVERFQGLPLRIGLLSRLVSSRDAAEVKAGLADGSVDIVIGTHALLGKAVKFKHLALLIVDEEQHFGVRQKERLKELRADVHVLTLTATPIPRTLQLALSGVRELSIIATPPIDRLAIRTFVLPFDPVVIREAILREHFRGGQTYYVCPRIEDLEGVREQLAELVPEARVAVAHGQMPASQLEDVMSAFYDGQFDVLLSTSIVESGLDIPSANTMVIHRAEMFGLAQLYQIRGRIGRSKQRGYAYLTYAPRTVLSGTAQQRLHVIETLDSLGAGFTLASHDMDIRGAGNLLGEEQSGHIREVGVELYQQMLREAVEAARGGETEAADAALAEEGWTPTINLGLPVRIPEAYVADLQVRLDLYRRISTLADAHEIEAFAAELIDRFGPLPEEVQNLLTLIRLKRLCQQAGIERLDGGPKGAVIAFRNNAFAKPDRLIDFIVKNGGSVKIRPDQRLVFSRLWNDTSHRVRGAEEIVGTLARLAA